MSKNLRFKHPIRISLVRFRITCSFRSICVESPNRTKTFELIFKQTNAILSRQDLKDLFRREVDDVVFVDLFSDESNKPRGCGIIEFEKAESVKTAMDKMNRFDLNGRNLVIKEDHGNERDKYGRVVAKSGAGSGGGGGGNSGGGSRDNFRRDRDEDRMLVEFLITRRDLFESRLNIPR